MIFLLHFIFISAFTILFVVSIKIIRPFRMHHERPLSTISLKISYLVYLFAFLVFAYMVLFFSRLKAGEEEPGSDNTLYYIIIITSFLLPNIGIMLRRKITKLRSHYNVLFTATNILIVLVLVALMRTIAWEF